MPLPLKDDPPVASDAARITDDELRWIDLYDELLQRYMNIDSTRALPAMSIRIHSMRIGYGRFLGLLMRLGVPALADRCRHEITLRQEFFVHMMVKVPPTDPADLESATEEMAADLAAIDSLEGRQHLQRMLSRLQLRELWVQAKAQPDNMEAH